MTNPVNLRLSLGAALIGALTLVCPGAEPDWWSDATNGILSQNPPNNSGPATIGQLKHVSGQARAALGAVVPQLGLDVDAAGFTLPALPPTLDAAWYADQRKVTNLGQLKHLAAPFYESMPFDWLGHQFSQNGITSPDGIHPWDPSTPVAENYKVANIGQLKAVFSLRFSQTEDGDQLPELWEYYWFDGLSAVDSTDWDYDGQTALQEFQNGTSPIDGIPAAPPVILKVEESGNNQDWLSTGGLANPILFRAVDDSDNPVADVEVIVVASDPSRFLEVSHPNDPHPDPYFVSGPAPIPAVTDSDGKLVVHLR